MSQNQVDELKRIRRVSDMLITGHALLKERYITFSLISDTLLFTCSTILCVIVFTDQKLLIEYFGSKYNLYIGIFSIFSFVYAFISMQLDWRIKAEKHKNAYEKYTELKFECGNILKNIETKDAVCIDTFLAKYYTLTPTIVAIPEKSFLECKKRHILKVFISKHLDEHPGSWIIWLKIKIWIRDNCNSSK